MATRKRAVSRKGRFQKRKGGISIPKKRAHKYKKGAKSSIRGAKRGYCKLCCGPHKPRHGLPPAKKLLSKGMSPRRARVILKRRCKAKTRSK